VKWRRTALRCSGHGGVQHVHLQGLGPGGVARTATAAVYPKLRMKMGIINFLYNRKLMNVKKWPKDMTYHTTGHYFDCIRCQLGRSCPRDIPHILWCHENVGMDVGLEELVREQDPLCHRTRWQNGRGRLIRKFWRRSNSRT